jgi:hypothetical protein
MKWHTLKARLGLGGQGSSTPFALPSVVLELEPDFVAGASLDGAAHQVRRMGVRELESGWLVPSPNAPNLSNESEVRRAISEVAKVVGNGSGRLGLVLPDGAVRVAVLRFETLPDDRKEAAALVSWKMREILPFAPEEARVCYQVFGRVRFQDSGGVHRTPETGEAGSVELLAVAVRNTVLAEYEAALESVDGGACLILPATLALLPLLPEDGETSQLLIHIFSGSVTTVVVAGNRLRFWRNRVLGRLAPEEASEELVREVGRVLATCDDHLKMELGRVWVCVRPPAPANLREELARSLGREVSPLAGGGGHAGMLTAPEQELFQRFGMPFAGLVANLG